MFCAGVYPWLDTEEGLAGAYLTATSLPAPLPDPLSLIEAPHILFDSSADGCGMSCAMSAPVIKNLKSEKDS